MIQRAIQTLVEYSNAVDLHGSTLIVVPIPEKESIYHDWIPPRYHQGPEPSHFLEGLVPALRESGILTLDLTRVFIASRQTSDQLLYQLDDTHWTDRGVQLAVEALVREILQPVAP